MNRPDSARTPEAFIRALGHGQAVHFSSDTLPLPTLPPMSIAFSREAGALGTTVAREVGRRLDWPVYDHELLERMAEEMHVHVEQLESVDERHVPWLLERMEAFAAVPFVSENAFARRLISTVLSLGARGNCIVVGRGSAHILPPLTTLRVRMFASFEDRVKTLIHEQGLTQPEAESRVKELDRERTIFLKTHFHVDPTKPENYDLLLNASTLAVPVCAEAIIAGLNARQRLREEQIKQATRSA